MEWKINATKTKVLCIARQWGRNWLRSNYRWTKGWASELFQVGLSGICHIRWWIPGERCQMQNSNGKEGFHGKKVADKQIEYGSEEKNRKEYHLECCTVCIREVDTDGNLEEGVRSFWNLCMRRMLKIGCTEKNHKWRIVEEKSIFRTIQQRKHYWLGHVHDVNNFGGKDSW